MENILEVKKLSKKFNGFELFKNKYDISIIDKPTIEDIMLIYIKGEK